MDAKILVRVFDAEMHPTGIEYPIVDSPLRRFVPDWAHPIIVRKLPFGLNTPKEVPTQENVDSMAYLPGIIGDTHAKEGRMIYIEASDAEKVMAKFPAFFKKAEDTVRLGRALLVNGQNYGATHGKLRIKVVKPGTMVNGILVEDGTIIVNPRIVSPQGNAIVLGSTANNFSIFQGLDFKAIKDDVERLSKDLRRDVQSININKMFHTTSEAFGVSDTLKASFLKMCPQLERHPWFSNSISDVAARWMNSHAFAPYLKMKCFLAIASKKWTLPVGQWLAYRHPKIAGASLRALTIKEVNTLPMNILGGVVVTVTGTDFTIKGAGPIADIGKWDVITCDKNVKIGTLISGEVDASLVVLMRYHRNALMGVPVKDFKPMNGDYDGDLINIVYTGEPYEFRDCSSLPQIFANVKKHEKDSENFKFTQKSDTPWTQDNAIHVLLNAMHSSMGGATNMNSWWLSMNKEERTQLLPEIYPAAIDLMFKMNPELSLADMPEMSLKAIDDILQFHVQYHVDAIKNLNCDTYRVETSESRLTSILSVFTAKIPGYLTHRRGMQARVTYKTAFPQFLNEMDPDELDKCKTDSKLKAHAQWRMQIPNTIHGTPVQCFLLNREPLEVFFEKLLKRENITMDPRNFSNWVPPVSNHDAALGEMLMRLFREHIARFETLRVKGVINLFHVDDIEMYRSQWRQTCTDFARQNFRSNMDAALALWRVTHDSGDHLVSGAVFLGFPDEAAFIVRKWNGSLFAHRCIIVGVAGLMPDLPKELKLKVEIITEGNFTYLHPVDPIPDNTKDVFGHVAQIKAKDIHDGMSVPADGIYQATLILMSSGSAYFGVFEPI